MDGFGIERQDVETTLLKGMKWKKTDNEKWHANMAGIEAVFIKNKDIIFIITVYQNGATK